MIYVQVAEALSRSEYAQPAAEVDLETLQRAAQKTLEIDGTHPDADLSLVLTEDSQVHALNVQYMDVDAPTDVLSFPSGETDPDTQAYYLGDVVISYPQALLQAEAGRHKLLDELQLLVVHGVLHLLGYDHAEDAEKARMWARQAEILSYLGCAVTMPPG
jgi:probable rRNA maturation factor